MKKTIGAKRRILWCGIFLFFVAMGSVQAFSPTVTLGLLLEELFFPSAGSADALTNLQISGLIAWRNKLGPGSYYSFSAAAELNSYLYSNPVFSDLEDLELELSVPAGSNRVDLSTGLAASLLGTMTSPAFLRPDWQIKYRLERGRRQLRPYAAYQGYYLFQPSGDEDAFYQGAEIGFLYWPSLRLGYEASLQGGWEGWRDRYLFDSAGDPTEDQREDLLFSVNGSVSGLAGYFCRWKLTGQGGMRRSNANRYLEDLLLLEANSESNWFMYEEASLSWSPQRQIDLQFGVFSRQEYYLERQALTEAGALSGELLRVFSTGLSARFDWTPNDRLFLVANGEAAWRLANDPNEERWTAKLGLGVEYSF